MPRPVNHTQRSGPGAGERSRISSSHIGGAQCIKITSQPELSALLPSPSPGQPRGLATSCFYIPASSATWPAVSHPRPALPWAGRMLGSGEKVPHFRREDAKSRPFRSTRSSAFPLAFGSSFFCAAFNRVVGLPSASALSASMTPAAVAGYLVIGTLQIGVSPRSVSPDCLSGYLALSIKDRTTIFLLYAALSNTVFPIAGAVVARCANIITVVAGGAPGVGPAVDRIPYDTENVRVFAGDTGNAFRSCSSAAVWLNTQTASRIFHSRITTGGHLKFGRPPSLIRRHFVGIPTTAVSADVSPCSPPILQRSLSAVAN